VRSVPRTDRLTAGRLLARNSVLNLAAHGLPLVAAVALIPPLITGLGPERFGILAIAWMLLGYFGVLDLGMGRAVTQAIAERSAGGRSGTIPGITATATIALIVLGVVFGLVLVAASAAIAGLLVVPAELVAETRRAVMVTAIALPAVLGASVPRAELEAHQRFGIVSLVRIPLGILTFAAPLAVLPLSRDLGVVLGALALARYLAWGAFALAARKVRPAWGREAGFERAELGRLLRFGGWVTVSNVVSPLMVSADRIVVGAAISAAAVTFYVTPFEVVTKLWIVPAAVLGVLFPAFAAAHAADPGRATDLFRRTAWAVTGIVLPLAVVLSAFAPEGLQLWLGAEFAERSAGVARWLVLGVFVNCLAHTPYAFLQAAGRPDVPAKLHLLEIPVYALLLVVLVPRFGIEGVAAAWTARAVIDTFGLLVLVGHVHPVLRRAAAESAGVVVLGAAVVGGAVLVDGAWARVLVSLLVAVLGIMLALRGAWSRGPGPQHAHDAVRAEVSNE